MKYWKIIAALPLIAVSLWAASPAVDKLLLPEDVYPQLDVLLKRAVQQSPQMLNRMLDLEIAENNRIQARSSMLPGVSTAYRHYQSSDDRADLTGRTNVTKVYYDVSIVQPVFHWGERRNNARIGVIQQKIAEGNFRDGYRLLAQAIRQQYMQLIVYKILLQRSLLAQKYNQDVLKLSEERYSKGIMADAEIFPVRLNAERAEIDLERSRNDFESAKLSLARLTGTALLEDQAIPDEIPLLAHPMEVYKELLADFLALKEPPTIQADNLRRQIEIENLTYLNHKTRLRPKFSLAAGITQDEQTYSINVAQKYRVNSLYGGITVGWTIFDGFASRAAVSSALARRRQLENDYQGLTERLGSEAQSQVKQLNFAARSMSIVDRLLIAADNGLRTKQGEFSRGVVSENDVTLTQLARLNAFIDTQNARIDYLVRLTDLLGTIAQDPVVDNVPAQP